VHVFAADRIWLARIRGAPAATFVTDADYHLAVLQKDWPALMDDWKQWAAGLSDDTAQAVISHSDLRGNVWQQAVWQIVLHVVNHGTHHRGQAAGFLRAMGHTPPPLDLVRYYRSLPQT
jgi:uncharacterized damage-inducible protein DinB